MESSARILIGFIIFTAFSLSLYCSDSPAPTDRKEEIPETAVVRGNNISLRTAPLSTAAEIESLPHGERIKILREEKGYTYGARTSFSGTTIPGSFSASSSVRSSATLESVQIFKTSMEKYREGIPEEDLEFTKNALIKSYALDFETIGSLLNMLNNISSYGLPADYVKNEEAIIREMTLERHKELAQKYIDPANMFYLIVGDAETQLEPLKEIGFGDPILLEF